MATLLNECADYVRPDLRMCPDPVIEEYMLRSAIDICRRAFALQWWYKWEITDGDVVDGVIEVPLSNCSYMAPCAVLEVTVGEDKPQVILQSAYPADLPSAPTIEFSGLCDGNYTLAANVALTPTNDAPSIDDALWDRWKDVISSGAKSKIYMIPGKPWTSPELAAFHINELIKGKSEIRLQSARGGADHLSLQVEPILFI